MGGVVVLFVSFYRHREHRYTRNAGLRGRRNKEHLGRVIHRELGNCVTSMGILHTAQPRLRLLQTPTPKRGVIFLLVIFLSHQFPHATLLHFILKSVNRSRARAIFPLPFDVEKYQ